MPHEIADSDAESDFNSPRKTTLADESAFAHGTPTAASQINFEDYMDLTQRLSFSSSNIQSGEKATNSTIRLFDGIQEAHDALNVTPTDERSTDSINISPLMLSKKRAHSVMHERSNTSDYDASVTNSKVKRTKTYGHRSKSGALEHNDLFVTSPQPLLERASTRFPDQSSDIGTSRFSDPDPSKRISLLDQSMQTSMQHMTTSTASMGGYASINLDYRGSAEVDVNSNPFGSLSQVSLIEDPNPLETERVANMFHTSRKSFPHDPVMEDSLRTSEKPQLPSYMSSHQSLEQPNFVTHSLSTEIHLQPQGTSRNDQDRSNLAPQNPVSVPDKTDKAEAQAPTKKRGRKPKNPTMPSESPAPAGPDETMDEQGLPDLELIRRTRQGTVDSISATSQASSSTKRRKQMKSKQFANPEEALDGSPAKQPTSELNLSDEHLIGLPKESYKPRPSRSRSKRLTGDDEVLHPPNTVDTTTRTPAKNKSLSIDTSPGGAESPVLPAKSSTKKSRGKARVKRAKTSGVALKVAEPMLSEGEDDVVWMDSKPAPVKLELPPDLRKLKKEEGEKSASEVALEDDSSPVKGKTSNITIEIPLAPGEPPLQTASKAAPKKRGRKPKKAQPDQQAEVKAPERDNAEEELLPAENGRKPLSEKSSNVSTPKARSSTPKAPTVSPLSSPETEAKSMPQKTASPAKITTPSKSVVVEKGPTKHSPINPPSLAGSAYSAGKKTLYRIGLSRRQNIPSLLRRVQRDKAPPKIVVAKEKEKKKKNAGDNGSDDDNDEDRREMRGADGMLVEWGD